MEKTQKPGGADDYRPSMIKLLGLFQKAPTIIHLPVAIMVLLAAPLVPARAKEFILFRHRNAWTRGVAEEVNKNIGLDLEKSR